MASYRSKCMEVVTRLYDDDGNALITNQTLNDFFTANQDKIEMACLIVHDKDPYVEEDIEKLRKKGVPNPESYLGKIKPRHVHIPIKWRNSVYYNSVAKQLGLQDGQIEKPRVKRKQFEAMATYITHKSPKEQAKGKHVYPDSAVQVIIGGFDYKVSPFQTNGGIILEGIFATTGGNAASLGREMEGYEADRRSKGHFAYPCAGSVFKNNRAFGLPSGKIIDNLGLRGYTVGGAKISEHHANIIVNSGHATAQDVKDLVSLVEDKVREATGFQLEREIIYV